jgi:hypothetical protein
MTVNTDAPGAIDLLRASVAERRKTIFEHSEELEACCTCRHGYGNGEVRCMLTRQFHMEDFFCECWTANPPATRGYQRNR